MQDSVKLSEPTNSLVLMMIGKVVQNSVFVHRLLLPRASRMHCLLIFVVLFLQFICKLILPDKQTKIRDMSFGSRKVEASQKSLNFKVWQIL